MPESTNDKPQVERGLKKSEDEPPAKNLQSDTEKLIDWALQSIIAWSVILFTAIIGLVGLLPDIHSYSGNLGEPLSLILVYTGFLATLVLSILRTSQLYRELINHQNELPEVMKVRFQKQTRLNIAYNRFFANPCASRILSVVVTALFIFTSYF